MITELQPGFPEECPHVDPEQPLGAVHIESPRDFDSGFYYNLINLNTGKIR